MWERLKEDILKKCLLLAKTVSCCTMKTLTRRLAGHNVFPEFRFPVCILCVWLFINPKIRCIIFLPVLLVVYLIYVFNVQQIKYVFKVDTYNLPCEMPVLDPFDPDQVRNIRRSEPLRCDLSPNPVFVDDNNILQLNHSALDLLKMEDSSIKCMCRIIRRVDNSDDKVIYSNTFKCTPPYDVQSDFFTIRCFSKDMEFFNTILTKIQRSEKVFGRHADDFYSVILFGMDSVSRNNAIRQIPKAVKYLQEELSSIDLLMYNRVGGHTFDNIVPILTGLLAKTEDIPYLDNIGTRFDILPLIWRNFSQHHYATFFTEDVLQFNAFNFEKEGFKDPPTDHYMRPFWIADYDSRPTNFLFWKESMSNYNKRRCLANTPKYLVQINYLKQFISTYRNVRKFALSHLNDLSHENINDLHLAEDDLVNFFKWFKNGGHTDNTFLIVFSDHGPRGQSNTHQSLLETNLPFLSIIPPYSFRNKHPDLIRNLKRNAQVLTTHFDLFATLSDVLHRQFIQPSDTSFHKTPRGISLFRDIHVQRSCSEASIPEQFCMCYGSQRLNVTNNSLIQEIAQSVVNKLNQLISGEKRCAFLNLKAVIEARVLVQGKQTEQRQRGLFNKFRDVVSERDYADYKLVVETLPGNGKFFATSKTNADGSRYVLDTIERVNRYKNQSHCVNEEKLKPLCYCKTQ